MNELEKERFDVQWPADRPFQVVAMGLNAVDTICVLPRYPDHGGKLRIDERYYLGGGQIATAGALCGRYGLRTRYIGRVGDDEVGRFSLQDLHKEPMEVAHVEVVPGAYSQFAVILVDRPTGERTILWDRDDRLLYAPGELKREPIVQGQLLHLDGHDVEASIQAARWAREAGMLVTLDIDKVKAGVKELLQLTDFAIPSHDFAEELADGDWSRGLIEIGRLAQVAAVVTRGSEGAALYWQGDVIAVPGYTVPVADTTGAGDVFHGAFIYALFQKMGILDCVRFSNAAAAVSCTRYGARASIPTLDEANAQLAREPNGPAQRL